MNLMLPSDISRTEAGRLLREAFERVGIETASLDSRFLILAALDITQTDLIIRGDAILTDQECQQLSDWCTRRCNHEPVGRIVGEREFWGIPFQLGSETLEPRPDTETLVEAVLKWVDETGGRHAPLSLVDVGTGSGCIAVALLSELPHAICLGVDINPDALRVARHNADRAAVGSRFFPVCASYLDAIGDVDVVVSNPPYIASGVIPELSVSVRNFDPLRALDGGEDGLEAYRALTVSMDRLRCGGLTAGFLEIGYDQGVPVSNLAMKLEGCIVRIDQDLGGCDRVVEVIFSK